MYLLIVYDVTRNPWIYTIFSVSTEFSFILANIVGILKLAAFCIEEDIPTDENSNPYTG